LDALNARREDLLRSDAHERAAMVRTHGRTELPSDARADRQDSRRQEPEQACIGDAEERGYLPDVTSRQPDAMAGPRRLERQFGPGVARAHNEDVARRELRWVPVLPRMNLRDPGIEICGPARYQRSLVRPRRDDHLFR